jgi:hypothetical protein
MKSTLHDELMREAGFESDYHTELTRRRERRQQKLRVTLLRAVRVAAVFAVLFGGIAVPLLHMFNVSAAYVRLGPYPVAVVALLVAFVADLLLDDMRGEGEPRGLFRRTLWRCGRSVLRAGKRVASGLGREA